LKATGRGRNPWKGFSPHWTTRLSGPDDTYTPRTIPSDRVDRDSDLMNCMFIALALLAKERNTLEGLTLLM
jgi:hypothetical protein